ncbi:MAG: hypothetical protein GX989_08070 [Firmicutes bacterium]|nr:hypothetical protein [Bacillota bacterium]
MAWLSAVMFIIFFMETPILFRSRMYRELLYFSLLWVLAFVYATLTVLRVPLPTVVEALKFIYSRIS